MPLHHIQHPVRHRGCNSDQRRHALETVEDIDKALYGVIALLCYRSPCCLNLSLEPVLRSGGTTSAAYLYRYTLIKHRKAETIQISVLFLCLVPFLLQNVSSKLLCGDPENARRPSKPSQDLPMQGYQTPLCI